MRLQIATFLSRIFFSHFCLFRRFCLLRRFRIFNAQLILFIAVNIIASEVCATEAQSPRLVIIIDDLGNNLALSQRAARLDGAITLSILPYTPFGTATAELGHRLGKEIMLHVPMSNTHAFPLGKGGLNSGMSEEELIRTLRQDLNSLPHVQGVNNHMGSKLTQERIPMEWLVNELRNRGLYFVDSRTTDKTVAFNLAIGAQLPALKRDIFLDDDTSPTMIRAQLDKAISVARQRGYAVAIGHPYTSTLNVIEQALESLRSGQIRLAPPSKILGESTPVSPLLPLLITSPPLNYCPALPYFAWPQPKPDAAFSDILHRTFVDWLAVD